MSYWQNPPAAREQLVLFAERLEDRIPHDHPVRLVDEILAGYDESQDCYYCPQGRRLDYEERKKETRRDQQIIRDVYRSADCSGCPLVESCRKPNAKKNRSVSRDAYEKRRQQHADKMALAESQVRYKKRFHFGEVGFAMLKVLGLRRFLLRGLKNVKTEWQWCCTGYNLSKLLRAVARLRAEGAAVKLVLEG